MRPEKLVTVLVEVPAASADRATVERFLEKMPARLEIEPNNPFMGCAIANACT